MRRYSELLASRPFALLWAGATVSVFGDELTSVALVWLVYERTGSPVQVGFLVAAHTAPVVVGGLLAGWALDRFDRRRVMIADSLVRGVAVALIPLLSHLGALALWHFYAVAAVYGFLKMISLAGVPTLIPSLVPRAHLNTANALESISYGIGGVSGPAIAALLIARIGGANVLWIDAATYAVFALCLAAIPPMRQAGRAAAGGQGLGPAVRFVVGSPAIRTITIMFAIANIGTGMLSVLVPVYAREVLRLGVGAYGSLLSAMAVGTLLGSLAVGSIAWPWPLGRSIAAMQTAWGTAILALLLAPSLPTATGIMALVGLLSSPLTVWAQTVRMRLIPPQLRGRTFGLLRTLMQSSPPIGGAGGGALLAAAGPATAVALIALAVAGPGVAGLLTRSLAPEQTEPDPHD